MNCGPWKEALIDIDRATEFTGDDVDVYSKLVDLGDIYKGLLIKLPAITSAAISVCVQQSDSIAEVPVVLHYRQSSDNATAAWATTASEGSLVILCPALGGAQYVRIKSGANQGADRSIQVRGVN